MKRRHMVRYTPVENTRVFSGELDGAWVVNLQVGGEMAFADAYLDAKGARRLAANLERAAARIEAEERRAQRARKSGGGRR